MKACCCCMNYQKTSAGKGECRLNPPSVSLVGGDPVSGFQVSAYWPPVKDSHWCGQWQPGLEQPKVKDVVFEG